MGIQTLTTPAGEELVVMTRAEYDALVQAAEEAFEDGADAATYAAAKAALKAEDILPPEVSGFVLKGDSALRAFRKWRGLSQQELSAATGLTQGFLSDLENRNRALTAEVAAKLRQALDLPVSWLAP